MMKTFTFLLFPENDDELIALADEPERQNAIVKKIAQSVAFARSKPSVELYYDHENVNTFLTKLGLLNEPYLNNIRTQILRLFGKTSIDLRFKPQKGDNTFFYQFLSGQLTLIVPCLGLQEFTERTYQFNLKNQLVFDLSDCTERTTAHFYLIREDMAQHPSLPEFLCLPFVYLQADFENWLNENTDKTPIVQDPTRFRKTNRPPQQGQPVYEESKTGYLWYLDNLHKDHYEVYNKQGEHIATANLEGNLNPNSRVPGRKIN